MAVFKGCGESDHWGVAANEYFRPLAPGGKGILSGEEIPEVRGFGPDSAGA